jgi:hypothetical protein
LPRAPENARWPSEPKGEAHNALIAVFRTVRDECEWRVESDELHLGYYKMSERHGVRGGSLRGCSYDAATLPYNVCRGAVDTLQSKIAKHRPLPQCMTQRGNWTKQKRARKMSEFLEGEFYRQKIYEKQAPLIVRDALIFGRGHLRVWVEGKRIKTERVHPWELFADEWDARYGSPRNIYHVRSMDKGVALETFARTKSGGWNQTIKSAIEQAGRFSDRLEADSGVGSTVDRIDIVEAYHLCDRPEEHERGEDQTDDDEDADEGNGEERGKGETPTKHKCTGRHVVFTTAGTLLDEPWEYDYFPYVTLGYNEAVTGCWATGLIEQLEGYQYQINEASERLAEQYRLSGVHVLVPDNAKISYQDIRNGIHIMGHQPGGEPKAQHMDLVNEHMRARPGELRQDALNDAGLSEMSVQSEKPAGVTAAVALQTLDDIETERFLIFGRGFIAWNLEVGRRFIDCAKLIAKTHGDHAVSVPMRRGIVKLKWTDVYVDGVELRVSPTSVLPTEMPARLERLNSMFESGQIDNETYWRNLESPDMQAEMELMIADKLVIDETLERMLEADEEEGEDAYMPPSAYQPFEWAARRAQQKYNRALLDGCPEYNLDFLRRYMKHCDVEIKKQTASAPAPTNTNGAPPMPGAAPPADPMAPMAPPAGPAMPMAA